MNLIDNDVLIAEYDRVHVGEPGKARQLMCDAPTVEERKTGKWIYITDGHYEYFKCDQCEKHSGEPTPFCRYCGADMEESR